MNRSIYPNFSAAGTGSRRLGVFLLAVIMLSLAGCGRTKVYTADKTVVYRDSIYNMSTVKKIGAREEARTPAGEVVKERFAKGSDTASESYQKTGATRLGLLVVCTDRAPTPGRCPARTDGPQQSAGLFRR